MRNVTLTVLAALAVLLLAVSGVAAHDNDGKTTDHDDAPVNGSAAERAAWMEQHMTEHMASHQRDSTMHGGAMNGMMNGTMNGGMGCH